MTGDFTGFSFDGIHSSILGITRVSSGDRYKEELQSEVRDKTIEIPGNDGDYYYGSTYGPKTHTIDIVFDSMTETQFRQLRQLFGTKKVCELIFDERPYKVYYAKIESPIELEYICFDEEEWYWDDNNHEGYIQNSIDHKVYTGNKRRIYKGEGSIELVSYYPFAKQLYRILEHYSQTPAGVEYTNVDEWRESSRLLDAESWTNKQINQIQNMNLSSGYRYGINVYNPGDLDVGFCLYIPFNDNGKISPDDNKSFIVINGDTDTLLLNEITKRGEFDTGIIVNTVNHLIEGVNYSYINNEYDKRTPAWQTTGTLYNDAIIAGDFPHIRHMDWGSWDGLINLDGVLQGVYISCGEMPQDKNIEIYYNYLYF